MIKFQRIVGFFILSLILISLPSCVYETPDLAQCSKEIKLIIRTDLSQLPDSIINYTRSAGTETSYQIRIYPEKNHFVPLIDTVIYNNSDNFKEIAIPVNLTLGKYDILVWGDYCDANSGKSLYYNTEKFDSISFKEPYKGDSSLKQAYRGKVSITITEKDFVNSEYITDITITSPLSRYMFVATDLGDFINQEVNKGRIKETFLSEYQGSPIYNSLFDSYKVIVKYTGFLSTAFDNFTDNPIFSSSGISYTGEIKVLSSSEALIASDYVMVNGEESSVQVMLEIYDSSGEPVSRTAPFNIPTKRGRTTIITGKFLTTLQENGVGIDPEFSGDYNYEIK